MKKKVRIILIIIASIVVLCTIFAVVDYNRLKNGKVPIFALKSSGHSRQDIFVESDENNPYSGYQYVATEYYGLGYKLVACDSCEKSVYFMPFGIGAYAWFIGTPIDKLNGRWFHAHNNDIYLSFDGLGYYSLSTYDKITDEGTYALNEDSVVLTPKDSSDIGNCTVLNNYHELHCDKYYEIFMK